MTHKTNYVKPIKKMTHRTGENLHSRPQQKIARVHAKKNKYDHTPHQPFVYNPIEADQGFSHH